MHSLPAPPGKRKAYLQKAMRKPAIAQHFTTFAGSKNALKHFSIVFHLHNIVSLFGILLSVKGKGLRS